MTLTYKPSIRDVRNVIFQVWLQDFILTNCFIWQLIISFWWKFL